MVDQTPSSIPIEFLSWNVLGCNVTPLTKDSPGVSAEAKFEMFQDAEQMMMNALSQWQRGCCCDGRSVGKPGPGRVCGVLREAVTIHTQRRSTYVER